MRTFVLLSFLLSSSVAYAGFKTDTLSVTGYEDFTGISNPASPSAGIGRFHAATTNGFTRFEQDNEAATNLVLGRDNVFIARNTTGSPIAKGQAVYVTGATGNVPNIGLALANSTTTLPAVGVALDSISANSFGQVMKLGVISNFNTAAFTVGDSLWVSTSTAGALTNVRPLIPNLVERIGTVLVSGVGNGSMLVVTAPFVGGMDSGSIASTFSVNSLISNSKNVCLEDGTHCPSGVSLPMVRSLYFSAGAGLCQATNGCQTAAQYQTANSSVTYIANTFTAGSTQYWQANFSIPGNFFASSTFTAQVLWTSTAAATANWKIDMVAVDTPGAIDSTWGSVISISTTCAAGGTLNRSQESGAITPAGTAAANKTLYVRLYRGDPAIDLRLLGLRIFYQIGQLAEH